MQSPDSDRTQSESAVTSDNQQTNLPPAIAVAYGISVLALIYVSCSDLYELKLGDEEGWLQWFLYAIPLALCCLHPVIVIHVGWYFPANEKISTIGWGILNLVLNVLALSGSFIFEIYPALPTEFLFTVCGLCPALLIFGWTTVGAVFGQGQDPGEEDTSRRVVKSRLTIAKLILLTSAIALVLARVLMSNAWGETYFDSVLLKYKNFFVFSWKPLAMAGSVYLLLFVPASYMLGRSSHPGRDGFSVTVLGLSVLLLVSLFAAVFWGDTGIYAPQVTWLSVTIMWIYWSVGIAYWPAAESKTDSPRMMSEWIAKSAFLVSVVLTLYAAWWTVDFHMSSNRKAEIELPSSSSRNFEREDVTRIHRDMAQILTEVESDIDQVLGRNLFQAPQGLGWLDVAWPLPPEDSARFKMLKRVLKKHEESLDECPGYCEQILRNSPTETYRNYLLPSVWFLRVYVALVESKPKEAADLIDDFAILFHLLELNPYSPQVLAISDQISAGQTVIPKSFEWVELAIIQNSYRKDFVARYLNCINEATESSDRGLPSRIESELLPVDEIDFSTLSSISCNNFFNFSSRQVATSIVESEIKKLLIELGDSLEKNPFQIPEIWTHPPELTTMREKLCFSLIPGNHRARKYARALVANYHTQYRSYRFNVQVKRQEVFDFSCRAYERATGKLATKWEDLVPDYFDEALIDLYTRRPFLFSIPNEQWIKMQSKTGK